MNTLIQLLAKGMGNTSGTKTSEFKLLAGYMPLIGLVLIALAIFLPPGRLTPEQQTDLLIGGLGLLGAGPAIYGVSRGLAKSGTTDGPYDAETPDPATVPSNVIPPTPGVTTDGDAASRVAGL